MLCAPPAVAAPSDYPAAMALTLERWTASQTTSGFFAYGFDFLEDTESEKDAMSAPHLVRQALTGAVLADYALLTADPGAREPLRKLLAGLRAHSLPIGKKALQTFVETSGLLSSPIGRYKIHAALERFGLLYLKEGAGLVLSPTLTTHQRIPAQRPWRCSPSCATFRRPAIPVSRRVDVHGSTP